MEEILHHLGFKIPCKSWDTLPTSTGFSRISNINSINIWGCWSTSFLEGPAHHMVEATESIHRMPKWPPFLKVNPLKTRPVPIETRVIWVLGVQIYIAGMLLGCRIVNELLSSKYIYLSNSVRIHSVSVQTHGVQSNDLIDEAKLTVTHQKWHEPMGWWYMMVWHYLPMRNSMTIWITFRSESRKPITTRVDNQSSS